MFLIYKNKSNYNTRFFKEMLENDPEFKKQYDEMFQKLWGVIMNGESKGEG